MSNRMSVLKPALSMANDTLRPQLVANHRLSLVVGDSGPHRLDITLVGDRRDDWLVHSMVVERDGALLFCGQALARLLRATPMALVGRHVQQLLPGLTPERLLVRCGLAEDVPTELAPAPNEAARVLEATRRAWGLRRPVARARRIVRTDGTTLPIDLTYGALAVRGGRLMVLGVRQRTEAAQARLQQLADEIEGFATLALIVDTGGRIEYVNGALEQRLGYSAFELVGRPVSVLHAFDAPGASAFATSRPWIGHVAFRTRGGESLNEVIRVRPWTIGDGPISHLACLGRAAAHGQVRVGDLQDFERDTA